MVYRRRNARRRRSTRRRRPNRRVKRRRRQMRFRAGQINAAGGKPATPHSRTLRTVTAGHLLLPGVTCGADASFNINDWSAPADPDTTTMTIGGTAANVPSGHAEILSDGFDLVKVLSAMYRFNIRFKGDDNQAQDWIFGYRFTSGPSAIFTHTAGTVGIDNFKDLRQSRGWVWHRMSATHSGGSAHPSTKQINIRIPDVYKLAKKFIAPSIFGEVSKDFTHVITTGVDSTAVDVFLLITVMTIDGVALSAGDIQMDVDVFQKVKVWKNIADLVIERPIQEV